MGESKETKTNLVFQTYHVYLDLFSVLDKVYKKIEISPIMYV